MEKEKKISIEVEPFLTAAAIIGHNGSVWAQSETFPQEHLCRDNLSFVQKSVRTVMSKSPNKHNRLYTEACPLEDGLAEAIDEGRIGPRDDPKACSKILAEEFGWARILLRRSGVLDPKLLAQIWLLTCAREFST